MRLRWRDFLELLLIEEAPPTNSSVAFPRVIDKLTVRKVDEHRETLYDTTRWHRYVEGNVDQDAGAMLRDGVKVMAKKLGFLCYKELHEMPCIRS